VPPFVSEWRFFSRIAAAERRAGFEDRLNHVLGFVLWLVALFLLPFEAVYAQRHLNRLWEHHEHERFMAQHGLRGEPATV